MNVEHTFTIREGVCVGGPMDGLMLIAPTRGSATVPAPEHLRKKLRRSSYQWRDGKWHYDDPSDVHDCLQALDVWLGAHSAAMVCLDHVKAELEEYRKLVDILSTHS